MREIKFRAWKDNKMYKDILVSSTGWITKDETVGAPNWKETPIMQYTGLKDKNGKEIYDGDILMWNDSRKLEVKWGTVGWVVYGDLFKRFGYPDGDDCNEFNTKGYTNNSEIVGNIYENSELLK